MNNIEMAEFLRMKGHHSVHQNEGVDMEHFLLGYHPRPINHAELKKIAQSKGYQQNADGLWVNGFLLKVNMEKELV